ncbi:hypothetical protein L3X38_011072 [Prunus dulcis]|uniref:Uncharacterized protein n=1 Tax=Prunus dulcis TaxID=3755 RepID=A0AAD4WHE7_PRUDU|nr:hypothetical protein L3X38_011072 [Prunus dulcis]
MARWWIHVHVYNLGAQNIQKCEWTKIKVSVTQSQPEPQTGRIQGTVVSLIRIPDSHGPGVPETREANVKCTDKTEAADRGGGGLERKEGSVVVPTEPVPLSLEVCGGDRGGVKVLL